MQIEVLSKKQYQEFLNNSSRYFFQMQTEALDCAIKRGQEVEVLGLVHDDKIYAAAKISYFRYKMLFRYANISYGPVFRTDCLDDEIVQNAIAEAAEAEQKKKEKVDSENMAHRYGLKPGKTADKYVAEFREQAENEKQQKAEAAKAAAEAEEANAEDAKDSDKSTKGLTDSEKAKKQDSEDSKAVELKDNEKAESEKGCKEEVKKDNAASDKPKTKKEAAASSQKQEAGHNDAESSDKQGADKNDDDACDKRDAEKGVEKKKNSAENKNIGEEKSQAKKSINCQKKQKPNKPKQNKRKKSKAELAEEAKEAEIKRIQNLAKSDQNLINCALLPIFVEELQKYIKKQHREVVRLGIMPLLHRRFYRDIDAVAPNPPAVTAENKLFAMGFERIDNLLEDPTAQLKFIYSKEIEGMTYDEVLHSLSQNFRYYLNKAEKYDLQVRMITGDELNIYHSMMQHTMERKAIDERYAPEIDKTFFECYADKIMIPLCYMDTRKTLKYIDDQIEILESDIKEIEDQERLSRRSENRLKVFNEELERTRRRHEEVEELEKTYGEIINMSCGIFLFSPSDAIYFQGGAYDSFMDMCPNYYIHKIMIEEAIKRKCKYYNLFGVTGLDKKAADYGVLRFKQHFKGNAEEFLGYYTKRLGLI